MLRLYVHEAPLVASAMAFNFFLSLVPLIILLGYAAGRLARQHGIDAVLEPLLDSIPQAAHPMVRHEMERLAGSGGANLAPIGIVGFLWLASSGAHGSMDLFELAVNAHRRPWWKQRLIAVAWILVALSVVTAGGALAVSFEPEAASVTETAAPAPSASATPASKPPRSASSRPRAKFRKTLRALNEPVQRRSLVAFALAVTLSALAAFYRFAVEHPPRVRRRAWPGAAVALAAWFGVSWIFGEYVSSLGRYALFYGGLAAVAVLLIWLWLISLALLLGAEVNAQLEGVRDRG